MSNIRQYLKTRQEVKDGDIYEKKITKHRRNVKITIALIICAVVLALIGVKIFLDNRSFDSYEISDVMEMNGGGSQYYKYGKCMLVYSDDGISYIEDGKSVWNQAFEMKSPLVDICGDMMAICDLSTNVIYIYNKEGQQGKVETVYPVIALEVSEQGVVAAITQDSDTNRIEVLDKEGNSIAVGQTYVTGDGCPVDITLSNDGTKLAASYVYVDGGEAKSKVIFYNYSEIGKNEVSRIVGGFNHYEDTIVSKVEFLDNDTVVAYGDSLFTIYSMKEKPQMIEEIQLEQQIKSIFYSASNIGVIVSTGDYNKPYIIKVYDTKGKEELSETTDFAYSGIELEGDSLVLYNRNDMMLMTTSGMVRYSGTINEGIEKIIPTDKSNQYYVVNGENNIMKILLK